MTTICPAGTSNWRAYGRNNCCGMISVTNDYINFNTWYPGDRPKVGSPSDWDYCITSGWTPTAKQLERIVFYRTLNSYRQTRNDASNGGCPNTQTPYYFITTLNQVGLPASGGVCINKDRNLFETPIGAYPLRWFTYTEDGTREFITGQELYPRKSLGESSPLDCGNCPEGYVCDIELERCVSSKDSLLEISSGTGESTNTSKFVFFVLVALVVFVALTIILFLL